MATPDIFMATEAGTRPAEYAYEKEVARAVDRLRPYYRDFPAYAQRLEEVQDLLSTESIGASLV